MGLEGSGTKHPQLFCRMMEVVPASEDERGAKKRGHQVNH